jgi:hypothetical protein
MIGLEVNADYYVVHPDGEGYEGYCQHVWEGGGSIKLERIIENEYPLRDLLILNWQDGKLVDLYGTSWTVTESGEGRKQVAPTMLPDGA